MNLPKGMKTIQVVHIAQIVSKNFLINHKKLSNQYKLDEI